MGPKKLANEKAASEMPCIVPWPVGRVRVRVPSLEFCNGWGASFWKVWWETQAKGTCKNLKPSKRAYNINHPIIFI